VGGKGVEGGVQVSRAKEGVKVKGGVGDGEG
jgi:hypothetical protein